MLGVFLGFCDWHSKWGPATRLCGGRGTRAVGLQAFSRGLPVPHLMPRRSCQPLVFLLARRLR